MVKTFADGTRIAFDHGSFDEWCVFLTDPKGQRKAPYDRDYFAVIDRVVARQGPDRIWEIFVRIYERTTREPRPSVLTRITAAAGDFGADALAVDIALTSIYLGMIAEQNKENTRLGKRVKRLAMHQIVHQRMPVEEVVNFSRGMGWREIAAHCERHGF